MDHRKRFVSSDDAWAMFYHLEESIPWQDGIRTRGGGFTRKACGILPGYDIQFDNFLKKVLQNLGYTTSICLAGIYLNYYRNGDDYTPNHRHPDTKQLVISLGATRTFSFNSRKFPVSNGDVVIFDDQMHGVPKEPSCEEARISIAIFVPKN
jgi:hypothetical protein